MSPNAMQNYQRTKREDRSQLRMEHEIITSKVGDGVVSVEMFSAEAKRAPEVSRYDVRVG